MRVLVCPDSFTGTLSAAEAADAIARRLDRDGAGRRPATQRPLSRTVGPGFLSAVEGEPWRPPPVAAGERTKLGGAGRGSVPRDREGRRIDLTHRVDREPRSARGTPPGPPAPARSPARPRPWESATGSSRDAPGAGGASRSWLGVGGLTGHDRRGGPACRPRCALLLEGELDVGRRGAPDGVTGLNSTAWPRRRGGRGRRGPGNRCVMLPLLGPRAARRGFAPQSRGATADQRSSSRRRCGSGPTKTGWKGRNRGRPCSRGGSRRPGAGGGRRCPGLGCAPALWRPPCCRRPASPRRPVCVAPAAGAVDLVVTGEGSSTG